MQKYEAHCTQLAWLSLAVTVTQCDSDLGWTGPTWVWVTIRAAPGRRRRSRGRGGSRQATVTQLLWPGPSPLAQGLYTQCWSKSARKLEINQVGSLDTNSEQMPGSKQLSLLLSYILHSRSASLYISWSSFHFINICCCYYLAAMAATAGAATAPAVSLLAGFSITFLPVDRLRRADSALHLWSLASKLTPTQCLSRLGEGRGQMTAADPDWRQYHIVIPWYRSFNRQFIHPASFEV